MLNGQTPENWLQFNYSLKVGSTIQYNKKEETIKNIKETDDVGHIRTQYPVVIGINYEESMFPEKITWITLESIFKY